MPSKIRVSYTRCMVAIEASFGDDGWHYPMHSKTAIDKLIADLIEARDKAVQTAEVAATYRR